MNIRMTQRDYDEIRRALRQSFTSDPNADEAGCLLLIGVNQHALRSAVLVREVMVPGPGDLTDYGPGHIIYSAGFLRRAMLRVRELGLAGFLTVHTHPKSREHVSFSPFDDREDPGLMGNLYDQQPGGIFGSIVVGKAAMKGRVWDRICGGWIWLDELVVLGDSLRLIPMNGEPELTPPKPSEIFDRSLAITGRGALAVLSKMRIGVIGASGTGGLAIEALQRAGAGEIVIFEFDHYDITNLGRVLHARRSDAEKGRSKAERLKEVIDETGLGTHVTLVTHGDIRFTDVAAQLAGLDVIVGCVDNSHWARLVMSEVSYQYLIPYVDIGTEIGLSDETIQSLDTRVSYCTTERACLVCSRIIDLEQVRTEGLSDDELARVIAMGYATDTRLTAPAVMDLNMIAVGYGMLLVRHLIQPFLDAPIPTHIKGAVTVYSTRRTKTVRNDACLICGINGRKALGDSRSLTTKKADQGVANAA